MDISLEHKQSKKESYWHNLVLGDTGEYKEAVIEKLIGLHFPKTCESILDIGCGTCEVIFKYGKQLGAKKIACMDYDEKVIRRLQENYKDKSIQWIVQDIFHLSDWKEPSFDLVFMLDMLHEVYSFYGRKDRNLQTPIDHSLGLHFAKEALRNVALIVRKGGGILITDNVVCEENIDLVIRLKSKLVIQTVQYFLKNYPSKKMACEFIEEDLIKINSRDFCILSTQYNKVKQEKWDRWNVERFEIHQYMTVSEYREIFSTLGFALHYEMGTPLSAQDEWDADFEIQKGLTKLPQKRISLLAIKR